MKVKDVKLGEKYWTKVGDARVEVVVVEIVLAFMSKGPPKFKVRRVDNGSVLPKARTAASLHTGKVTPKFSPWKGTIS